MTDAAPATAVVPGTAPSERRWGKLLLALAVFLVAPPYVPQLRALLPIDNTILLFVPALAACCLVGWWAGGRLLLALIWVGLATLLAVAAWKGGAPDQSVSATIMANVLHKGAPLSSAFSNMERGWTLLIAGAFGLVCLFGTVGPFFPRALTALGLSLGLALVMSVAGSVGPGEARKAMQSELSRRNAESAATMDSTIKEHPKEWSQVIAMFPQAASLPSETDRLLKAISRQGLEVFPSLLALESLAALALAWTTYHRLGRARLGSPLGSLRDFRFNDQLVWGLIVGITVVFLPSLAFMRGFGRNLLVFFGALYAVRGLGVVSWFMSPGVFTVALAVGFAMLWWPVLQTIAVFGFMLLAVASFGLGLGDTWADWRNRARTIT